MHTITQTYLLGEALRRPRAGGPLSSCVHRRWALAGCAELSIWCVHVSRGPDLNIHTILVAGGRAAGAAGGGGREGGERVKDWSARLEGLEWGEVMEGLGDGGGA